MTVQEIADELALEIVAGADQVGKDITGGYASDLLSCVMAGAQAGNVWITLQAHLNVVAVAALLDLACVIITEGAHPDNDAIVRANEEGVPILLTKESTFTVVGKLHQLGVRGSK